MSDLQDLRTQLRDAILRGTYAPRQRLIEAELAEEYDASRFVVRNALIQLAADGLVELQPNRGARVREISVEEAVEITEIRPEPSLLARTTQVAYLLSFLTPVTGLVSWTVPLSTATQRSVRHMTTGLRAWLRVPYSSAEAR